VQHKTVQLGNIVIGLTYRRHSPPFELPASYQEFISDLSPDIILQVHKKKAWQFELDEILFDVPGRWTLGYWQGKKVIQRLLDGSDLHQVLILQPDLAAGEVYCVGDRWLEDSSVFYPLQYPLDMLLTINLLARGKGVAIHAAAVADMGKGRLFVGRSGAGKSTMAELWLNTTNARILNDDRVIISHQDGDYMMQGSPWHSRIPVVSSRPAPLEGIYFLKHGQENRIQPVTPTDAISQLMVCCFTTYWDPDGMKSTLDILDDLVKSIPCFNLSINPGDSVVNFIRAGNLDP
jgi:hypothetical protein